MLIPNVKLGQFESTAFQVFFYAKKKKELPMWQRKQHYQHKTHNVWGVEGHLTGITYYVVDGSGWL